MEDLGTVFLSVAAGNEMVAYVSALATGALIWGTHNKLKSVNHIKSLPENDDSLTENNPPNPLSLKDKLAKILESPPITAGTVASFAGVNALDRVFHASQGGPESIRFMLESLGWIMGCLGDSRTALNDIKNFPSDSGKDDDVCHDNVHDNQKNKNKNPSALKVAITNPILYFSAGSIPFTISTLLFTPFSPLYSTLGILAAGLYCGGVGHVIKNTQEAAKGKISTEIINDGRLNQLHIYAHSTQVAFFATTGNWLFAAAFTCFAIGAIFSLEETRRALGHYKNKKEDSAILPANSADVAPELP